MRHITRGIVGLSWCLGAAAAALGQCSEWSALGDGVNATVRAMAMFDDGSGPALYVGGDFTVAGGAPASRIARWDGRSWSALGAGVSDRVRALAVYDDGSGPALYVSGDFATAGGSPAALIARWDGASWSGVGGGMTPAFGDVEALAVFDDGTGEALYAAGLFETAGGVPTQNIARWDGATWSPVGSGLNDWATSLCAFDGGAGPELYAGGFFSQRVERWSGSSWSSLGSGTCCFIGRIVSALAAFDAGGAVGSHIYVGGSYESAGGVAGTGKIARWDGAAWSSVGGGTDDEVYAMAVFDDGSGPALYVSGAFSAAGGVAGTARLARWDGSNWSAVGGGVDLPPAGVLGAFDVDGGEALYAGGFFTTVGGVAANNIARWGCPPCYADCDGSGSLDFFDFLCFQNEFAAGSAYGDCDGSGSHDFFDFLCFQNAFAAGCE